MDCPLLRSVLLQLFAFHHHHHRSQGTLLVLFNNNAFQTGKWKRNETNKNEAFISSLTFCFRYYLTFQIFVSFQCAWYRFPELITNIVACWCEVKGKRWTVDGCLLCVFFRLHYSDSAQSVLCLCLISMIHSMTLLLCLQYSYLLSWRERKKEWIVDGCLLCVFFLLSPPLRVSSVSVVFDFNDSPNDAAPVSPILLPVDVKRRKRVIYLWMSFVCLLSIVFTTQIEFSECCVWFQCLP